MVQHLGIDSKFLHEQKHDILDSTKCFAARSLLVAIPRGSVSRLMLSRLKKVKNRRYFGVTRQRK